MVSSDKWPRLYQSCQNTKDVKYTCVSGWMGFVYPWGKFIIQVLITSSSFWKHINRVLTKSLNFLPFSGADSLEEKPQRKAEVACCNSEKNVL